MAPTKIAVIGICFGAVLCGLPLYPAAPARIMLLDGESGGPYHKWQLTTPVLKKQLEETGLFQVDVVTAPPAGGDFTTFKPEFKKDACIVLNYDAPDDRLSRDVESSVEHYMKDGGGLLIVDA